VLKGKVPINGQKYIERLLSQREQLAVLEGRPTCLGHGRYLMAFDFSREASIDALIEKDFHLRSLRDDLFHCLIEKSDNLFARNRRESVEKIVNRLAPLQVVDKRLHGNSRPGKYRRATKDIGRGCDHGLLHETKVTPRRSVTQALCATTAPTGNHSMILALPLEELPPNSH
jgi:hypothetical protein